jgi:serine/threonine protein kinase/Tol biopolymer transport system component
MTLTGTQIGPYRVGAPLGSGAMGEVYRAHDTTLGRDVAIKMLPPAFTSDPDRRARFEREARLLASLNHPHIATVYSVEVSERGPALVMELVEGPTLAERIAGLTVKGSGLPVGETLQLARQIAEALDAAHERGVVHRDLKPANIKLTADGQVKILDFGLATAVERVGVGQSAIDTRLVSQAGMVVGTAAYMSPEQARGQVVDKRTDIWAFGCVLYELLTAKPVFTGDTLTDVMVGVVDREPDWAALPASTPWRVRELLQRCLQKDPRNRQRDIGDARADLNAADGTAPTDRDASVPRRERIAWSAAVAVLVLLATAFALRSAKYARPIAREMRVDITTPPTMDPVSLAISPDGRQIAFVADSEGRSRLWVRALDSPSARTLVGTDNASYPFWSPDSRSLGFFAETDLKRLDLEDGSVRRLAIAGLGGGGTWNREGTVLFTENPGSPLVRVSANGGPVAAATALVPSQHIGHGFPQFLPDGRHFLFYVRGTPESRGVYVGQLDRPEIRRLADADSPAIFAAPGHLLFVRQRVLFAQAFDPDRATLTGTASPVVDRVMTVSRLVPAVSASSTSAIVFRAGAWQAARQFVWLDRSGREVNKLGDRDMGYPIGPTLSPDGRRVAMHRQAGGNTGDIWLLDTARAVLSRSTVNPAQDIFPTWSPDGSRILFASNRNGPYDLYVMPAGGGPEERVIPPSVADNASKVPTDWSRDGHVLFDQVGPAGPGIWALSLDGERKTFPVAQSSFVERDGQFSPDGRWVAFESNESGRFEIYVQRFPGPGAKSQVSNNGGAQVRWRGDGRELLYVALDSRLTSVPVGAASKTDTLDVGTPVPLFATSIGGAVQSTNRAQYSVSPDGQRFLMNSLLDEPIAPITLVLNWSPAP